MYLAESTLEKGDFEESTRLFGRARDIDPNSNRIQQGQQKSKRLLKQSQKKDYYKMLGVDRTASKRDIKRAFRKLATIWVC
jgi:DnaJ homolog subfamily C member 3